MADKQPLKLSVEQSYSIRNLKIFIQTNWINLVFGFLILLILPYMALLVDSYNEIIQSRQSGNPSYEWPSYKDLSTSLAAAVVIFIVHFCLKLLFKPIALKLADHVTVDKEGKAEQINGFLNKICYFGFSCFFAFYVAKDADFFPVSLGGKGSTEHMFRDYPYQEPLPLIREYLLIQLGHHFYNFAVHVCQAPRGDFIEMLLHHILTILLMGIGYFMNCLNVSLLILFVHDTSDLALYVTRICINSRISAIKICSYVSLLVVWSYLRLFVYYREIVAFITFRMPIEIYAINFVILMLFSLLMLNSYWLFLIVMAGVRSLKTNSLQETENRAS